MVVSRAFDKVERVQSAFHVDAGGAPEPRVPAQKLREDASFHLSRGDKLSKTHIGTILGSGTAPYRDKTSFCYM